jgi:hypothetical protein
MGHAVGRAGNLAPFMQRSSINETARSGFW